MKKLNYVKRISLIIVLVLFVITTNSQEWSEPINISNMEGSDSQPDFTIDQNGNIHCVWTHKYNSFYWKIFYSKSIDNGNTWSSPFDISLNDSIWIGGPNIISDSQNNLYVSYDYDLYNPNKTLILFTKFDGEYWGEADTVSSDMYSSWNNRLVIDNNDKIYIFWYFGEYTYYRSATNDILGEIKCPIEYKMATTKILADNNNNLHCLAGHHGGISNNNKYVYFYYNPINGYWSDTIEISKVTSIAGEDIALDNSGFPHFAWRQKTPSTGPDNDSTIYRYFNGIIWSDPQLIVEDPKEQQIEIDEFNQVNIFDVEKTLYGNMLVHYYKYNSIWTGYFIDETEWSSMKPVTMNYNNMLYIQYVKSFQEDNGEVMFSKSDIITNTFSKQNQISDISIYPNPFARILKINYKTTVRVRNHIHVYSISGQLIKTLKDKTEAPGKYEIIWDGTDKNGKRVALGFYLIRVFSGRYVWTRSVEYVH